MPVAIYSKATTNTIPAGAIYASPSGVSTNAGTADSPKDLASAYTATPAGGTLVLKGSLNSPYRTSLTVGKRINIVTAPGEEPVLSGSRIVPASAFTLESGDVYYYDHTPQYPGVSASYVTPTRPQVANLQQVFVNGTPLTQVNTKAELAPNSFYFNGSRIFIKGSPTGKTIELSVLGNGIVINANGAGTSISGLVLVRYGSVGIQVSGNDVQLNKVNTFYNGFRNVFVASGRNITLLDVGSYYAGCTGVKVAENTPDFKMVGGQIVGCNASGFAVYWDAAGLKMLGQNNGYPFVSRGIRLIKDVLVQDNLAHGIWLDLNCFDTRVCRNTVSGGHAGIIVEVSHNNYVVDNLVFNTTHGIVLQNAKRNTVANNTTVLNNRNIVIKGTGRINDDAEQKAAGYDWKTEDNQVYNNIIDRTRSNSSDALLLEQELENLSTEALSVLRNNAYNRESASRPTNIINFKTEATTYTRYSSLTDVRADFPSFEVGSIGRTAITPHPYFTPGTMSVKADSPTIGAGMAVTGAVADILGVTPGTVVNIGSSIGAEAVEPPPSTSCQSEIEEATQPLMSQINRLNDDLAAANRRIAEFEDQSATIVRLTAERDTAFSQLATANSTISELNTKLTAVKVQLQNTIAYIG